MIKVVSKDSLSIQEHIMLYTCTWLYHYIGYVALISKAVFPLLSTRYSFRYIFMYLF